MKDQKTQGIEEEKVRSDPGMQSARVPGECTGARNDRPLLLSICYMSGVVLNLIMTLVFHPRVCWPGLYQLDMS